MFNAMLNPYRSAEAHRLALVFAGVYFAQGLGRLPVQPTTVVLKDGFGYSATQVATFFALTTIPWLIQPAYGLLSDFVPLFGRRRKSYLMLNCALAAAAGLVLSLWPAYTPLRLTLLCMVMGLGLAFTAVITDALLVENGKRLGLTGGFQSVQWASLYTASVLVGMGGGALTEHSSLHLAFFLAALFPLLACSIACFAIREERVGGQARQWQATWPALRGALHARDLWVVAGFILCWTFSPPIGTPFFFYQTDTLQFSQQFIGTLTSLSATAAIVGALAYAGMARSWSIKAILNGSVGLGVTSTLAYLAYTDAMSALIVEVMVGCIDMIAMLSFLDLAAQACPKQAEGTCFALLMAVFSAGEQGSEIVSGWLYDSFGYTWMILIGAAFTALCWLLIPLVEPAVPDGRKWVGDSSEPK